MPRGSYHGERCPEGGFACIVSPLEAVSTLNAGGTTVGTKGVEVSSRSLNNISAAVDMAAASDAVVLLVGIDGSQEREEHVCSVTYCVWTSEVHHMQASTRAESQGSRSLELLFYLSLILGLM